MGGDSWSSLLIMVPIMALPWKSLWPWGPQYDALWFWCFTGDTPQSAEHLSRKKKQQQQWSIALQVRLPQSPVSWHPPAPIRIRTWSALTITLATITDLKNLMISRTVAIIIVANTYIICPEYCLTETCHFYVFYISHKFYELESVTSFNFTGKETEQKFI